MNKLVIENYNFVQQKFDFAINHPVKEGCIAIKDIDLGCTIYEFRIFNVNPPLYLFCTPCNKAGFDFDREDFGGFEFQLIDDGEVLESHFMRFRHTGLEKYRYDIKDNFHPSFVNYREFFVDDIYQQLEYPNLDVVLDVGASIGLFTKYILKKGAKQVFAFEPDIRSINLLGQNFFNKPSVNIIPKALSSTSEIKKLWYLPDNPLISSIIPEWTEEDHTTEVECISFKDFIKDYKISKIDLLKLDIEGAEYEVIDTLDEEDLDKINSILLEWHIPMWMGRKIEDIINKLSRYGFNYKIVQQEDFTARNGILYFWK